MALFFAVQHETKPRVVPDVMCTGGTKYRKSSSRNTPLLVRPPRRREPFPTDCVAHGQALRKVVYIAVSTEDADEADSCGEMTSSRDKLFGETTHADGPVEVSHSVYEDQADML